MSVNPKASLAMSLAGFAMVVLGFTGYTGLLNTGKSLSVALAALGIILVIVSYVHAFHGEDLFGRA